MTNARLVVTLQQIADALVSDEEAFGVLLDKVVNSGRLNDRLDLIWYSMYDPDSVERFLKKLLEAKPVFSV